MLGICWKNGIEVCSITRISGFCSKFRFDILRGMKNIYLSGFTAALVVTSFFIVPVSVDAKEKCNFNGYLEIGSTGEEVRCLQKFLNSSGFTISNEGVGSPGKETDTFREKTKEALVKWQIAKNILPATGYFGPLSRSTYEAEFAASSGSGATTQPPVVVPSNVTMIPINPVPTASVSTNVSTNESSKDKKLKKLIKEVRDAIKSAKRDIDNAKDDGKDIAQPEKMITRAEDKFLDAVYAYFDAEYDKSEELINKSKDYVKDSIKDISGSNEDALDAINDAKDAMSDARKAINKAEDNDDDTDDSRNLYDKAKNKYDDAREEYDDENYDKAEKLAKEAENLFEDAVDAL